AEAGVRVAGCVADVGVVAASFVVFFFQAEDGIRDWSVTGAQTCALPIWCDEQRADQLRAVEQVAGFRPRGGDGGDRGHGVGPCEIGRASCRERGEISGGGGSLKEKE